MTEGVFRGKAAQKALELFTDIIKSHDKLDAFIKNPEQVTKTAIGEELDDRQMKAVRDVASSMNKLNPEVIGATGGHRGNPPFSAD